MVTITEFKESGRYKYLKDGDNIIKEDKNGIFFVTNYPEKYADLYNTDIYKHTLQDIYLILVKPERHSRNGWF